MGFADYRRCTGGLREAILKGGDTQQLMVYAG
jgi:hypothetical protein